MKRVLILCSMLLLCGTTAMANVLQIVGFEINVSEDITVCLTTNGEITQFSTPAGMIQRDSKDTISRIGEVAIVRNSEQRITQIGNVAITLNSAHLITAIGDIAIKRDDRDVIIGLGNAIVQRDDEQRIVNVSGDPRVRPVLAEDTGTPLGE